MNAAAIETLIAKGLSAEDILDVAKALERKKDNTAAERQARYRAKRKAKKSNARNSNGVTPPIDNNHTPSVISSDEEKHSNDPFPCPEWCEKSVWSDLKKNRKAKKLANTATAHKQFLAEVAKLTDDEWPPGRLVEAIVARGWGGAYDPRSDRKPNNDNRTNSNRNTADLARAKLGLG